MFGDGGAVITNDDKIKKIKSLRDHGRDEINERLLAMVLMQDWTIYKLVYYVNLQYHNEKIDRRRHIASYIKIGYNILQLKLPPKPGKTIYILIYIKIMKLELIIEIN